MICVGVKMICRDFLGKMIIGVVRLYSCGGRRRAGKSRPPLRRSNCGIPNPEYPVCGRQLERGRGYTSCLHWNSGHRSRV
jgi:hypothetical protein